MNKTAKTGISVATMLLGMHVHCYDFTPIYDFEKVEGFGLGKFVGEMFLPNNDEIESFKQSTKPTQRPKTQAKYVAQVSNQKPVIAQQTKITQNTRLSSSDKLAVNSDTPKRQEIFEHPEKIAQTINSAVKRESQATTPNKNWLTGFHLGAGVIFDFNKYDASVNVAAEYANMADYVMWHRINKNASGQVTSEQFKTIKELFMFPTIAPNNKLPGYFKFLGWGNQAEFINLEESIGGTYIPRDGKTYYTHRLSKFHSTKTVAGGEIKGSLYHTFDNRFVFGLDLSLGLATKAKDVLDINNSFSSKENVEKAKVYNDKLYLNYNANIPDAAGKIDLNRLRDGIFGTEVTPSIDVSLLKSGWYLLNYYYAVTGVPKATLNHDVIVSEEPLNSLVINSFGQDGVYKDLEEDVNHAGTAEFEKDVLSPTAALIVGSYFNDYFVGLRFGFNYMTGKIYNLKNPDGTFVSESAHKIHRFSPLVGVQLMKRLASGIFVYLTYDHMFGIQKNYFNSPIKKFKRSQDRFGLGLSYQFGTNPNTLTEGSDNNAVLQNALNMTGFWVSIGANFTSNKYESDIIVAAEYANITKKIKGREISNTASGQVTPDQFEAIKELVQSDIVTAGDDFLSWGGTAEFLNKKTAVSSGEVSGSQKTFYTHRMVKASASKNVSGGELKSSYYLNAANGLVFGIDLSLGLTQRTQKTVYLDASFASRDTVVKSRTLDETLYYSPGGQNFNYMLSGFIPIEVTLETPSDELKNTRFLLSYARPRSGVVNATENKDAVVSTSPLDSSLIINPRNDDGSYQDLDAPVNEKVASAKFERDCLSPTAAFVVGGNYKGFHVGLRLGANYTSGKIHELKVSGSDFTSEARHRIRQVSPTLGFQVMKNVTKNVSIYMTFDHTLKAHKTNCNSPIRSLSKCQNRISFGLSCHAFKPIR